MVETKLTIAIYISATSVGHPGWKAAVSCGVQRWSLFKGGCVCLWFNTISSDILPEKWEPWYLQLNQEIFLQWLCNLQSIFLKKKLLCYEIWMVKICQLSTNLGPLSDFPYCTTRGHIPLGAHVQPSVTNDHLLWSLHNLWRSPEHTQQIDLMGNEIYLIPRIHMWP